MISSQYLDARALNDQDLRDIARWVLVFDIYLAQFLQNIHFWNQNPFRLVEEEMPVVSHYNRYQYRTTGDFEHDQHTYNTSCYTLCRH